jgi:hypothetical protein
MGREFLHCGIFLVLYTLPTNVLQRTPRHRSGSFSAQQYRTSP